MLDRITLPQALLLLALALGVMFALKVLDVPLYGLLFWKYLFN